MKNHTNTKIFEWQFSTTIEDVYLAPESKKRACRTIAFQISHISPGNFVLITYDDYFWVLIPESATVGQH